MKTTNNSTKEYKGFRFVFEPVKGRGYKVHADNYTTYWYQSTKSVRKAYERFTE